MAAFSTKIEIVYNKLPKLTAELSGLVDEVVHKAAFRVERQAKLEAPVDTSFLRNSIYTATAKSSGYAQATASAKRAADRPVLAEVAAPGPHQALVAVGAEYGVYVEYGTSRAPAQPFMRPAAENARGWFIAALERLLRGLQ